MNVKRFLGLALFTYLMCAAFAVVNQKDTPPQTYAVVPATITLGDLSPQQLQDRAVELTTTTSTSTTTSTQPTTKVAYVDPSTKATTASDIAAYAVNEEIARAVIDSVIPEGFYYKKKVLHFEGSGSDFLPIWDDVKKILSVHENNVLIEDRQYEVSSDKTAIVEKSVDNINRAESAPLVLPAASSDSLDPQFVYRGFGRGWDYLIAVEYGYTTVPSDIVRATEMLVHDIECGKLDYYKRFISSYNTDQYRIQFDKGLFEGTGNIIVDKILSKYAKSITKIGVL
jgi:hypothetical protein